MKVTIRISRGFQGTTLDDFVTLKRFLMQTRRKGLGAFFRQLVTRGHTLQEERGGRLEDGGDLVIEAHVEDLSEFLRRIGAVQPDQE